jgi:hypothetical protein
MNGIENALLRERLRARAKAGAITTQASSPPLRPHLPIDRAAASLARFTQGTVVQLEPDPAAQGR